MENQKTRPYSHTIIIPFNKQSELRLLDLTNQVFYYKEQKTFVKRVDIRSTRFQELVIESSKTGPVIRYESFDKKRYEINVKYILQPELNKKYTRSIYIYINGPYGWYHPDIKYCYNSLEFYLIKKSGQRITLQQFYDTFTNTVNIYLWDSGCRTMKDVTNFVEEHVYKHEVKNNTILNYFHKK